ncbi:protein angel homolog 1 [Nerophis ophidion]|uniref:protein angel homolog 1 n=1 Tax=Nerophis ophidion TaxID=159077 RepID=UPI002AE01D65|nr:protein angel homolog 1 [Nerophis ophidion]
MRTSKHGSMIGCLLFYALYPLSRYLLNKQPSESANKGRPCAVNGRRACDGAAVTTRMFTQFNKHLLHLWFGQRGESKGPNEERLSKQCSSEVDNTPNAEQSISVLPKDTKNQAALNTVSVAQSAEKETLSAVQQNAPDAPQGHVRKTHFPLKQQCIEESDIMQYAACPTEQSMRVLRLDKSESSRLERECWDEYLAPAADDKLDGGTNSNLALASVQTIAQIHHRDKQAGWHFPIGHNLDDEVHCPLWRFPALSYYPSLEPKESFEVMWRVWQEMKSDYPTTSFTMPTMDFTVMSYNILAQDLLMANIQLYKHCRLEVLDWNYRWSLLLEEISRWAPDILCLQEVQENHYDTLLYPALTQMGYNCIYKRRTGNKTDGCATCYRSTRFSEVSVTLLEFFRPETELLDRHNVGIVLLLRPLVYQGSKVSAKGSLLCVANTHLLFNPRRGDIKLAQLAIILAEIDSVVKSWKAKSEHCNVIMCGDFNSVPHTPLYQLITNGELYFHGIAAWRVSGQQNVSQKTSCHTLFAPLWPSSLGISDNCQYVTASEVDEGYSTVAGKLQYSHNVLLKLRSSPVSLVRPRDLQVIPGVTDNTPDISSLKQPYFQRFGPIIRHQLDLESVYNHSYRPHDHSEVTTLHSEGGATVDHIFYSPKRIFTSDQAAAGKIGSEGLKLVGFLSLLSEEALWSMDGLPNHTFPSDHLSLLAKLRLDLKAAF